MPTVASMLRSLGISSMNRISVESIRSVHSRQLLQADGERMDEPFGRRSAS